MVERPAVEWQPLRETSRCKQGELLETQTSQVVGNQQPSPEQSGKVQRLSLTGVHLKKWKRLAPNLIHGISMVMI